MTSADQVPSLHALLGLDGQTLFSGTSARHRVKFGIRRLSATPEGFHSLDIAPTLHGSADEQLASLDSALGGEGLRSRALAVDNAGPSASAADGAGLRVRRYRDPARQILDGVGYGAAGARDIAMSGTDAGGVLRVGIAPCEEMKTRTMSIARGEHGITADEPRVWFASLESFTRVLSERNRELLSLIAEREPASLTELATLSGRAKPNLSRTLRTMERHGLVELQRGEGRTLRPRVRYRGIRLDLPVAGDVRRFAGQQAT